MHLKKKKKQCKIIDVHYATATLIPEVINECIKTLLSHKTMEKRRYFCKYLNGGEYALYRPREIPQFRIQSLHNGFSYKE